MSLWYLGSDIPIERLRPRKRKEDENEEDGSEENTKSEHRREIVENCGGGWGTVRLPFLAC